MQWRWANILCVFATSCVVAGAALSAPPAGNAVKTETIIREADPDAIKSVSPGPNDTATESDTFEPEVSTGSPENFGPPPVIQYDFSNLPPPVRRLRQQIIEAALTGEIENLRSIFEANEEPILISFNEVNDPIEQLKALAGDAEGREILAILVEVFDAGYVHVDVGTLDEMYVWPYFARYPVDDLTGKQMVELFKLLTADDYEDMKVFGAYMFYRVGIAPNGVWKFFVAGD